MPTNFRIPIPSLDGQLPNEILAIDENGKVLQWKLITEVGGGGGGGAHPNLEAHDLMGLATQTDLDNHAATAGHTHPNLTTHDGMGLATDAELTAHAATPHTNEAIVAHGAMGTTETFDVTQGTIHTGTLDANCTFTFTAPPSGRGYSFTLILTQDATGSRTVAWPASVKWPEGTVPTLSTGANKVDILTFFTIDAGVTWRGALAQLDSR